jgi:hypothetical protein
LDADGVFQEQRCATANRFNHAELTHHLVFLNNDGGVVMHGTGVVRGDNGGVVNHQSAWRSSSSAWTSGMIPHEHGVDGTLRKGLSFSGHFMYIMRPTEA